MSSSNTAPARTAGNDRVLTIDWSLLFRRIASRGRQAFTSARYQAQQTEYVPSAWMQRLGISWFRLGLIAIALFVFTQKQVDFKVSMGEEGLAFGVSQRTASPTEGAAAGAGEGRTATMSLIPSFTGNSKETAVPAWSVDELDEAAVRAYISRFEKVAQGEERKYSIPAAANMALAIIHSNAGKSTAATKKNNHFFPVTANTYYENAWMNWRSHSKLISEKYPELAAESVNYQQWTAALARTNYSNNPKLADRIMDVVERYGLERL
ncbi:glucosaminidase domain-containing protein [Lewinella sp. 4G2]|uniref:glucosaminidase domain-containing protein n=1 Tax=Lewinella sp. 4G2 TaxID=1803372 RepID=UPI0012FB308A|nr:glucosaminidase domain-containing protein [Lewinella sp. 4G2]